MTHDSCRNMFENDNTMLNDPELKEVIFYVLLMRLLCFKLHAVGNDDVQSGFTTQLDQV